MSLNIVREWVNIKLYELYKVTILFNIDFLMFQDTAKRYKKLYFKMEVTFLCVLCCALIFILTLREHATWIIVNYFYMSRTQYLGNIKIGDVPSCVYRCCCVTDDLFIEIWRSSWLILLKEIDFMMIAYLYIICLGFISEVALLCVNDLPAEMPLQCSVFFSNGKENFSYLVIRHNHSSSGVDNRITTSILVPHYI